MESKSKNRWERYLAASDGAFRDNRNGGTTNKIPL